MRELATKGIFLGRVRDGLIKEQMTDALRQMGLSPELFLANDVDQTIALLYSCVESQLPVIVGIPSHVVTVIGHGYKDQMDFDANQTTMASCVNGFIAHDDATRPYRWMGLGTGMFDGQRMLTLGGERVEWCIFPEPQRVNLRRSDIVSHLGQWLQELAAIKPKDTQGNLVPWFSEDELKGLVTREYLRKSDKFKADIYPSSCDERLRLCGFAARPIELVVRYWRLAMPKYVWIVELARKEDLAGRAPTDRRLIGEVIFDSTGYHQDPIGSLLAFHLNQQLLIRKSPIDSEELEFVNLSMHNSYSPLMRSVGRSTTSSA